MGTLKEYGIHRVPVPGTPVTAIAIVVIIALFMIGWPQLRRVALASVAIGLLVAGGLILRRRRSRAVPAARLNFPPDV